jgi:hypothetical protein
MCLNSLLIKLENEPPLRFSHMFVVDANFSTKRIAKVGQRAIGDCRTFKDSDYYMPNSWVDKFDGEVKSRPQPKEGDLIDNDLNEQEESDDGDPTDGDPTDGMPTGLLPTIPCANHWKASAAEERKRMWGVFEESGIFASACRHGMILWIIDMVRSGELYVLHSSIYIPTHNWGQELNTR